jgi:hypothetical protein
MSLTDTFGSGIALVIIIFSIVYAVLTFLLPFIVWGILRQAKLSNLITGQTMDTLELMRKDLAKQSEKIAETAYQLELTVAALQRIKEGSDQLVSHAQYQTEVTRHRIDMESSANRGE